MEIKAIETEYKGYKFRSRLEARWAIFFDTAGIPWEYEKEGYELSTGERYLPDFYLPKNDIFVEVKGVKPNKKYLSMLETFSKEIKKSVLLVIGVISEGECLLYCQDFELYAEGEYEYLWLSLEIRIMPFMTKKLWFSVEEGTADTLAYLNGYIIPVCQYGDLLSDQLIFHIDWFADEFTSKSIKSMKQARFEHKKTPLFKGIEPKIPELKQPIKSKPKPIKVTDEKPETIKEEFEMLWSLYPRRNGKKEAQQAYFEAREKGVSFEIVRDGLEGYINHLQESKGKKEYTKYGSTWFKDSGWMEHTKENN
jgi:hypothetical protein